jgi:hypothetical protein
MNEDIRTYTLDRELYYHKHIEIGNWCDQHFGVDNWARTFVFGSQFFQFKYEKDEAFFVMTWL